MADAIEITTFRLVNGARMADFVRANLDVDRWLLQQPGFKSRWIAEGTDDTVVDTLLWSSGDAARSAMARLMTELSDSPVHDLIDQRTVTWRVVHVAHTLRVKS